MDTFVFQIEDKIDKLTKPLGINIGYWSIRSYTFYNNDIYCGLYVGERPHFRKDTFYGVSYDRRGTTYRSEAFKALKEMLKFLEQLSDETFFFKALTQTVDLEFWPNGLDLKGEK